MPTHITTHITNIKDKKRLIKSENRLKGLMNNIKPVIYHRLNSIVFYPHYISSNHLGISFENREEDVKVELRSQNLYHHRGLLGLVLDLLLL